MIFPANSCVKTNPGARLRAHLAAAGIPKAGVPSPAPAGEGGRRQPPGEGSGVFFAATSRGALRGLSLLELLVTVAIMVILSVLFMSSLTGSSQSHQMADCVKNMEKIYLALSIYQNDNNGAFPALAGATNPAQPLSLLVPKSTTTTEIFICPGSGDAPLPEGIPFGTNKISYAYYMGRTSKDGGAILASDAQVDAAPKDIGQQLFSADGHKPGNNHGKDGGNLLICGGQVLRSGPKAARDLRYPPSVRMLNPQ